MGGDAGGLRRQGGFTLAELVMVCAILASLSLLAMPVVKFTAKRSKEMELRGDLREMRAAIDQYKRFSDQGLLPVELGSEGYPKDLDSLVKGIELVGQIDRKMKFLRRIPFDPMTGKEQDPSADKEREADPPPCDAQKHETCDDDRNSNGVHRLVPGIGVLVVVLRHVLTQ